MFEINDYVVVVGATLSQKGSRSNYKFEVCRILEVAKYEIIVDPLAGSYRRPYRVQKSNCTKINLESVTTHLPKRDPKIGDLVMYYHIGYDKIEKQVGILMSIVDNPGGFMLGKIIHGTKSEEVPFKDLMVLEEKQL